MLEQMSLWCEEEAATPTQTIDLRTGGYMVRHHEYVLGNNTTEQLERLAEALLGSKGTFTDTTGKIHVFLCISHGIVNGKLLAGYKYLSPLATFYGGDGTMQIEDDEE